MRNFPILQVEDSENDVLLLQHAFRQAGIHNPLRAVSDGQEAVDYLQGVGKYADRQRFPLPGLLLLDLKLPRMMGLQVLEWIRADPRFNTLIVVVLTSSGQKDDVDNAYRAGANAFLVKPSGVLEFIEFLKVFKTFWLHYNHPPGEEAHALHSSLSSSL